MSAFVYKLLIAYDGLHYVGWQVQPNGVSIQETLEKAFTILCKTPVKVIGSSRTDAGVHALGQVAHVALEKPIDLEKMLLALNGILPHDIRIKEMLEAPKGFHARFDARKKTYHYHLHCEPFHEPSKRLYSYHVRRSFDVEKLKEAASYFVGTHNFKAFANENEKGSAKHAPIKTLYAIRVEKEPGGYRLEFEGNGFLYKMVRNMVGALLECAYGKLDPLHIPQLLAAKVRPQTLRSAPAHGLFLVKVEY